MAHLTGPAHRSLELVPVQYQFSQGQDLDWLVVRVGVGNEQRVWSATAPAFLAEELRDLVRWCRGLASHELSTPATFEGTEPNLMFEAVGAGEQLRLRALFQLEFRPPGLPLVAPKLSFSEVDDEDVVVEFAPGAAGIRTFADELEAELRRMRSRRR